MPGDQDPPYIASDGRIYRRAADSTDPVPEKDRHAIDRLADMAAERQRRFADFCQDERTFSQSENNPWVHVFLSPEPLGLISKPSLFNRETLDALLTRTGEPAIVVLPGVADGTVTASIPFNQAQTAAGSAIFRQVEHGRDAFNGLAVEYFVGGTAKFHIPVQLRPDWAGPGNLQSSVVQSSIGRILVAGQSTGSSVLLRFVDIGKLWMCLAVLFRHYEEWIGADHWPSTYKVGLALKGVWRSVGCMDLDAWGEHVNRFGLPVMERDNVVIPLDIGRGLVLETVSPLPLWLQVCGQLATAFGLPNELFAQTFFLAAMKASGQIPQ